MTPNVSTMFIYKVAATTFKFKVKYELPVMLCDSSGCNDYSILLLKKVGVTFLLTIVTVFKIELVVH